MSNIKNDEFFIKDLSLKEFDILESSNIDWCPDYVSESIVNAVFFSEKDYQKALKLLKISRASAKYRMTKERK